MSMNGSKSSNKKQTFDIQPKQFPDVSKPAYVAQLTPGVPVSVPIVPDGVPVRPC